jgi:hypothetical protein
MRLVKSGAGANHGGMDIDTAAWITVKRALARVPLKKRRKVMRMLKLAVKKAASRQFATSSR